MINAAKSRRDDPLLTVDAIYGRKTARIAAKSRRDDPLLTVGFNLRWLRGINKMFLYINPRAKNNKNALTKIFLT